MQKFKSELYKRIEIIQSKSLANTIKEVLDAADIKFWAAPSSSSGRFHPAEDQGEQGLLRHVIKATYVFEQEARRLRFEDYEFDAGMAATILHDIKKNGEPWGKDTDYTHGIIGARFIDTFRFHNNTIKKIVSDSVRYHMAPWNTTISNERSSQARKDPKMPSFTYEELTKELEERTRGLFPNRVEKAVQDADYWASREVMSFYPGISIMPYKGESKICRRHDTPEDWAEDMLMFNNFKLEIKG